MPTEYVRAQKNEWKKQVRRALHSVYFLYSDTEYITLAPACISL